MAGPAARGEVVPLRSGADPTVVAELAAIAATGSPQPWSASLLAAELCRDDRVYIVAREGGRIVGFAGLAVLAGDAHILALTVVPAARGRGHGRRLVRALLAAALERGVAAVTLEVRTGNEVAQRLYRRLGFEAAGVRPGYYPDGEDAVIMWWRRAEGRRPTSPRRAGEEPRPAGG